MGFVTDIAGSASQKESGAELDIFSGLTDGAIITYFCSCNIQPVKHGTSSESRDLGNCLTHSEGSWCCHVNVNGAVQGGLWFAGGNWAAGADDRGG